MIAYKKNFCNITMNLLELKDTLETTMPWMYDTRIGILHKIIYLTEASILG